MTAIDEPVKTDADLRAALLDAALPVLERKGVRGIEVDHALAAAGEAAFGSVDELALACLEEREVRWTRGWVEAESRKRGDTPQEQLLAIFDLFDEWFARDDFEGCTFVNVLIERSGDRNDPLAAAAARHLEHIREYVQLLAEEANLRDAAELAAVLHMLMKGSIIHATEGRRSAAKHARSAARELIFQHTV